MDEGERLERDERDAEACSEAVLDPDFLAEVEALAAFYVADDLVGWED